MHSTQEVGRKKKLARCFKKWKFYFSPPKKQQRWDVFFSMEHRLLVGKKPLFWIFRGWKIRSSLSQKVDGNIFMYYWKVLVLNFSGMGNTVFFWDKKLMKRWYLLITEMLLFWTFRGWKIRPFLRQKVDGKMIFTDYWKVLVLSFFVMEYAVFFDANS